MQTRRTLKDELGDASSELLQRSETLIQQSNAISTHAPSSFPRATSHGPDHTSTVEAIGDMVMNSLFAILNPHELFFLRLSYYYHDLGMVGEEVEFTTEEGRDQIRRQHAISVGEKIKAQWHELGFQNENEATVLALICRGHRPKRNDEGVASWDELDAVTPIGPNESVRLRLVSSMIYAIDELHIGDDRANARLKKWIDLKDDESRRHWKRHDSIAGPTNVGGELLFSAVVKTSLQENDLRKNVFAKAFRAMRDLQEQLVKHNIDATMPQIVVQWNREALYKMLVFKAAADGKKKKHLIDEVTSNFSDTLREFEDLRELCKERGNEKRNRSRIVSVFRH